VERLVVEEDRIAALTVISLGKKPIASTISAVSKAPTWTRQTRDPSACSPRTGVAIGGGSPSAAGVPSWRIAAAERRPMPTAAAPVSPRPPRTRANVRRLIRPAW